MHFFNHKARKLCDIIRFRGVGGALLFLFGFQIKRNGDSHHPNMHALDKHGHCNYILNL